MEVRLIDASFLQMEVDAAEKRHRTRSKGVRGTAHSHGISCSLNLRSNPFPHFQSITESFYCLSRIITDVSSDEQGLLIGQVKQDLWGWKISLLIIIWFHCVMKLMLRCFLTNCFSLFFLSLFVVAVEAAQELFRSVCIQYGNHQLNSPCNTVYNLFIFIMWCFSEWNWILKVKQGIEFWYTLLLKVYK